MKLKAHTKERLRYKRLYISHDELALARDFTTQLLRKEWYERPGKRRRGTIYVQQTALTTALIITYARPFTRSRGWPILKARTLGYCPPEIKLHKKIMELRNQVYAHSDSDRYTVELIGPNWTIVSAPPLVLNEDDLVALKAMTAKAANSVQRELDGLYPILVKGPGATIS